MQSKEQTVNFNRLEATMPIIQRISIRILYFFTHHIFLIFWLSGISLFLVAYNLNSFNIDNIKIEKNNIFVSDNAKLLKDETKEKILEYNQNYERLSYKPQLMIITVKNLPFGQTIESYTNKIANDLGVGNSDYDNGVVYLLAKNNRQSRLEVGYGLEEIIPDALTNKITDETVKNYFRNGNYDAGISLVVDRLNDVIQGRKIEPAVSKNSDKAFQSIGTKIWNGLNTPILRSWFLVGMILVIFILWKIHGLGNYFARKLFYDKQLRLYKKDLLAENPTLDFNNLTELNRTKENLLYKLTKIDSKISVPVYTRFTFSYGDVTKAQFLKGNTDIVPSSNPGKLTIGQSILGKLVTTYINIVRVIGSFFSKISGDEIRTKKQKSQIKTYLLTPQKVFLFRFFQLLSSLILLAPIIAIFVWVKQGGLANSGVKKFLNLIDYMLFGRRSVLELFFIISVIVIVGGTIWMFYIDLVVTKDDAKRHRRLNSMIKHYLDDLRNESGLDISNKDLVKLIDNNSIKIMTIKNRLRDKLNQIKDNKGVHYPDYYDMEFAFGAISCEEFLQTIEPDADFIDSSIYRNHGSWYSNGPGDSPSGGSSYGGGSFGGGGGTSSW